MKGKRVLVTRAAEDAAELEDLLRARGAVPVRLPCIAFEDLPLAAKLAERVREGRFDLVVLSSPHAARRALDLIGRTSVPFAAVGSATAQGLPGDVIVPSRGAGAEALVAELAGKVRGKRVLLPQAERPTPALLEGLTRAGAEVEAFPLYRTVVPASADLSLLAGADAIAFASGSAVRGFVALAGATAARGKVVAAIGASTAAEAVAAGLSVDAVGDEGLTGLCEALALALGAGKG